MTSPYPPQTPPRRLERSRCNRSSVESAPAWPRYLNMDVTLVRVLTVVLAFFTGVPVVAYIVALFLMPEEPHAALRGSADRARPDGATGPSDPVWGPGGAPWDQTDGSVRRTPPRRRPRPARHPARHQAPSPDGRDAPTKLPPKVGQRPTPSRLRRRRPRRPHPARRAAGVGPGRPAGRRSEPGEETPPRDPTTWRVTNPRPDGHPASPRPPSVPRAKPASARDYSRANAGIARGS